MRCIYCGAEMFEWAKNCPSCGAKDYHSKVALRELKRKRGRAFAIIILAGLILGAAIFAFSYLMVERSIHISKYSLEAGQYLEAEDYEKALNSYCRILSDYPKSSVGRNGIVDVIIRMCENGEITDAEEGYSYIKKYGVYLNDEGVDKIWEAIDQYCK